MTLKLDNFIGLMIQRSEQTTERRLFECTEGNALLDGKRRSSCAVDQLGTFCIKLDAESWHILDGCRGYNRLWSLEITNVRDGLVFLGMVELLVSSKIARRLGDANLN